MDADVGVLTQSASVRQVLVTIRYEMLFRRVLRSQLDLPYGTELKSGKAEN